MIKITFTHSVVPNGPATDISIIFEIIRSTEVYNVLWSMVKPLVDENVILNYTTSITENNQFIQSHYATTPENAQLFLNKYNEAVAFWEPYGINWEMSQQEIDSATIDPTATVPIFDDNNVFYGLESN
jgi:hypothetical protein